MDDLKEALNYIDRVIGDRFKNLAIHVNQTKTLVKLTATCRVCAVDIWSEEAFETQGWATNLVSVLLTEADTHCRKRHQIIIPRGQ